MRTPKLIIVSDSHGNTTALQRIIDREAPFDYLVHCGDGIADLAHVRVPAGTRVLGVAGNIDRARLIDREAREELLLGNHRVLVTHGDAEQVHHDYLGIIDEAKSGGYDLVLFGHTHKQYLRKGGPVLFNPGPALNGQYGVIIAGEKLEFYHKVLSAE